MRYGRWAAAAVLAMVAALGTAGCGGDEEPDVTGTGSGAATLEVNDTALGEVLTDGDGGTLYLFTLDSEDASVCEGECLEAWPILEGEPEAGDGVDAGLIGSFERADGTTQASYAGHPLYYFSGDTGAGDLTGQGVEGVWWVLDASGTAVEDPVPEQDDGSAY